MRPISRWRWCYFWPGMVYCYITEGYHTKEEAKEVIRNSWFDGKRLPRGFQMWRKYDSGKRVYYPEKKT